MKAHTLEWVAKAEEDFGAAAWLQKAPSSHPSAVAFHCQQCVEKYLKAMLVESEDAVPRTHDLIALANLLTKQITFDESTRNCMRSLTWFAVETRYPSIVLSDDDAIVAVRTCREIRYRIRAFFGLAEIS